MSNKKWRKSLYYKENMVHKTRTNSLIRFGKKNQTILLLKIGNFFLICLGKSCKYENSMTFEMCQSKRKEELFLLMEDK